jgi:hypothetical protein
MPVAQDATVAVAEGVELDVATVGGVLRGVGAGGPLAQPARSTASSAAAAPPGVEPITSPA